MSSRSLIRLFHNQITFNSVHFFYNLWISCACACWLTKSFCSARMWSSRGRYERHAQREKIARTEVRCPTHDHNEMPKNFGCVLVRDRVNELKEIMKWMRKLRRFNQSPYCRMQGSVPSFPRKVFGVFGAFCLSFLFSFLKTQKGVSKTWSAIYYGLSSMPSPEVVGEMQLEINTEHNINPIVHSPRWPPNFLYC